MKMSKLIPLLFGFLYLSFLLPACVLFAPVNSLYETSEVLDNGDAEVQVSYGEYGVYAGGVGGDVINKNLGIKASLGLKSNKSIYGRYIFMDTRSFFSIFDLDEEEVSAHIHYSELGVKFGSASEKFAFMPSLGNYFIGDGLSHPALSSRFIWTNNLSQSVDLTLSPKADIFISAYPIFDIGMNIGLDVGPKKGPYHLNPEVGLLYIFGFPGLFLNAGLGFSYQF